MSDRPCSAWYMDPCILAGPSGEVSLLCQEFQRCMYAAPTESFTAEQLELLDAWLHARVSLLRFHRSGASSRTAI